jgi:hypothetical protein
MLHEFGRLLRENGSNALRALTSLARMSSHDFRASFCNILLPHVEKSIIELRGNWMQRGRSRVTIFDNSYTHALHYIGGNAMHLYMHASVGAEEQAAAILAGHGNIASLAVASYTLVHTSFHLSRSRAHRFSRQYYPSGVQGNSVYRVSSRLV